MASMTPEDEIEFLRAQCRKHRKYLVNVATIADGVCMRGKAGRNPVRYNAIMRIRDLLTEWENDCGGESE